MQKDINLQLGAGADEYPIYLEFMKKFNEYPSEYTIREVRFQDVIPFIQKHKENIIHEVTCHKQKHRLILNIDEFIYIIIAGYISESEENDYGINILYPISKRTYVEKYIKEFADIKDSAKISRNLNILCYDGCFYLKQKQIYTSDISIDENYNDDFRDVDEMIRKKITETTKGLFLLHGSAGTGKTTYIRYLTSMIDKKVIYLPPNIINSITDPNLISFFMEHTNSVLIIEDAESILMQRNEQSSNAVSNLLNLTDGLLSDFLQIQVLATFNTDILNIDKALLRKGRLHVKYKFEELMEHKVDFLAKKLGIKISGKQKLCDIYNHKEKSHTGNTEKNKVGFKIN